MRKALSQATLFLTALTCATLTASAQQTVHGLAGKVTAIYPATKMIKIATDDGSGNLFEVLVKETPLNFQKNVKSLTIPAAAFNKPNDQVVVFYFGDDQIRTAVALEDLGDAPLVKTSGTLLKIDKHDHTVLIKTDAGTEQSFHIDAKTIGEATNGVVLGDKFDADKGAKVRIVASTENGAETALFIRAMSF